MKKICADEKSCLQEISVIWGVVLDVSEDRSLPFAASFV
jgi:hypothetical protein